MQKKLFCCYLLRKVQRKIRTIFEQEEVPAILSNSWRLVKGRTGVYPSLPSPGAALPPTPQCPLLFLPPTSLSRYSSHLDDHSKAEEVPGKVEIQSLCTSLQTSLATIVTMACCTFYTRSTAFHFQTQEINLRQRYSFPQFTDEANK